MATMPCAEKLFPLTTASAVNLETIPKMDKKSFLQAGHTPTLLAAFLYFDLAFMVWVILGPLGIGIAKDLGLTHAQKGLMVATPVLAGALLRIVMGILVDRLSPKKAAIIGQVVVIAAMAYAWLVGVHSYAEVLVLGRAGDALEDGTGEGDHFAPPSRAGTRSRMACRIWPSELRNTPG